MSAWKTLERLLEAGQLGSPVKKSAVVPQGDEGPLDPNGVPWSTYIWPDFIFSGGASEEHYSPEEAEKFQYLGGTNRYAHNASQTDHSAAKAMGAVVKDDNGVFYNPEHWEVVQDPPHGQENRYWYNTDSNGTVALRAKTASAQRYLQLPDVKEWNRAFTGPSKHQS